MGFRGKKTEGESILKILLTNDDGIHAPGLWAAAQALSQVGEVCVVAPDREQSGVGASLTLHAPVVARSLEIPALERLSAAANEEAASPDDPQAEIRHRVTAFSVEGTPGDSCILALEKLVGSVDLVVSGINRGSNLGWDVMVSGTVGAAFQGYFRGYPTIAISVGSVQNPRFDGAASLLRLMAQKLAEEAAQNSAHPELVEGRNPFLLNINVPSLAPDQITGVEITRPGGRSYGESVREEGTGHQKRYWIARNRPVMADNGEGTDMNATKNNRISITPLHLNLSHQEALPRVEALLAGVPEALLGKGG